MEAVGAYTYLYFCFDGGQLLIIDGGQLLIIAAEALCRGRRLPAAAERGALLARSLLVRRARGHEGSPGAAPSTQPIAPFLPRWSAGWRRWPLAPSREAVEQALLLLAVGRRGVSDAPGEEVLRDCTAWVGWDGGCTAGVTGRRVARRFCALLTRCD
jgi:hypothetical protein